MAQAPINVSPEMDMHLRQVVRALQDGRLVFFLGAGANLCDRRTGWTWTQWQRESLPSGIELATHLAETFRVEPAGDLAKVAQYVELQEEIGPLYDTLQSLFDADARAGRLAIEKPLAEWSFRHRLGPEETYVAAADLVEELLSQVAVGTLALREGELAPASQSSANARRIETPRTCSSC